MTDNTKSIAAEIVEAILRDIEGRKGVGDELEAIDPEIYDEMFADLVDVAFSKLGNHTYFGSLHIQFTPEEGEAFFARQEALYDALGSAADDVLEMCGEEVISDRIARELP